jgi:hypothetical protein
MTVLKCTMLEYSIVFCVGAFGGGTIGFLVLILSI